VPAAALKTIFICASRAEIAARNETLACESHAQLDLAAFPNADSRSGLGHGFEAASARPAWQAGFLARDIRQPSSQSL